MAALKRALLPAAIGVLLLSGIAAAQGPTVGRPDVPPLWRAVGSFLGTVVVGAILLGLSPGYARRITDRIDAEPLVSALWGVGILALFIGGAFLLAITVIGIVLVIPLAIGFVILGVVGNAVGYLALFSSFTESHWYALLAGGIVAGVTGVVPVLGDLVGFLVGSLGVGAIVRDFRA